MRILKQIKNEVGGSSLKKFPKLPREKRRKK